MNAMETLLLNYALNAVWQIPVIFAAAWVAGRLSRRLGPPFHHRLWVSALVAEVLLPACSVQPAAVLRLLQPWLRLGTHSNLHKAGHVTVVMGSGHLKGGLQLPPALLASVALVYLGSVLFSASKLSLGVYRTTRLQRSAQPITLAGDAGLSYQRLQRRFSIQDNLLATSSEIAVPMTMGIRHRMLLLPAGTEAELTSEDLDAALAHEFAHMRRYDFAKNILFEVLSLPAAFHPLLWLTRSRIAETRELLCDSLAAEAVAGRQKYARSLLRLALKFADPVHPPIPHAIGIFDANHFNNFERRIMHLTNKPIELKGTRRLAILAASLFLGGAACTSALAFRMQVAAPAPQPDPQRAEVVLAVPRSDMAEPAPSILVDIPPGTIVEDSPSTARVQGLSPIVAKAVVNTRVQADVQAIVRDDVKATVDATIQATTETTTPIPGGAMAGNRLTEVQPVYPPEAKSAGIEGVVLLRAVIGKDGKIENLQVVSGPAELTRSALDAVRQWTYKPYLLNGDPVAVETTITVNYSLQN